jgi:hypothetical protein
MQGLILFSLAGLSMRMARLLACCCIVLGSVALMPDAAAAQVPRTMEAPTSATCASVTEERLRVEQLTPAQRHADLRFLADQLKQRHGKLFHDLPERSFDQEVSHLDRQLDPMNPDELFVRMDALANSVGDGHTYVRFPCYTPMFPLRFRPFGKTFRLVSTGGDQAAEKYSGWQLIAIGNVKIQTAGPELLTLTPANETIGLRRWRAAAMISNGVVLHGLHLALNPSKVTYTLGSDDGRFAHIDVDAEEARAKPQRLAVDPGAAPVDESSFSCKMMNGQAVEYCDFHSYRDLNETSKALSDTADRFHPDKLVLDLRNNTGGDFCEGLKYVVEPVAQRRDLNRPGHLFVLIGPRTFSAGMANAEHFRQLTAAVLVGEPAGELPNSYQEAMEMTLPNLHWIARYSTKFYRLSRGTQNLVQPDKAITTTWKDYQAGKDPALAWAAHIRPELISGHRRPPLGTEPAELSVCD